MGERVIKFKSDSAGVSETYVKLKPLTDEQVEKGFYMELPVNGVIEGFLRGTRLSTGKFAGKTQFVIESLDGSKTMVIESAGNLKAAIERKGIQVGDALLITYKGKSPIKEGNWKGTMAHTFQVLGEDKEA